ncbi:MULTISPECIES: hypothetical protein [unclassified Burkholderia]|uniref:hypothetical protein n=1 Tax=unclassified Burkholderia TaxID=2613784 RepID=UPI002AB1887A|nr:MULTISPECIES: hypothetical protein [unclassified Burkholderia]
MSDSQQPQRLDLDGLIQRISPVLAEVYVTLTGQERWPDDPAGTKSPLDRMLEAVLDAARVARLERDIVRTLTNSDRERIANRKEQMGACRGLEVAGVEIGVDCLVKVRSLLTRLGVATSESIEGFGAELEKHLYALVRAAHASLDSAADKSTGAS